MSNGESYNDMLKMRLLSAIEGERITHAVLITGNDRALSERFAKQAAALLLKNGDDTIEKLANNPDYIEMGGANSSVSKVTIDDMRVLYENLMKRSFYGGKRAVVLLNADKLNPASQNSFLKTLEEPPPDTMFFLTGEETGLLSTIRSRCAIVRLGALTCEEIEEILLENGIERQKAEMISQICGNSLERALHLSTDNDLMQVRDEADEALVKVLTGGIDFSLTQKMFGNKSKTAQEARELALEVTEFMLSFLRDCLMYVENNKGEIFNRDKLEIIAKLANEKSKKINNAIECVIEARQKMDSNAGASVTIDGLIIELSKL